EIKPFRPVQLEDLQLDPLVYKVRVPLPPSVDLGNYRSLRVPYEEVTVDEAEVEAELEALRQDYAILSPAGDRPAALGDQASLELDIRLEGEEEEPFLAEEVSLVLEADATFPAPGFAEQVVGMKVGDEKRFTLTYPDPFDPNPDLAGRTATFTVRLTDLQNRELPEMDDDLARTVGDYDSLEDLRTTIRERIREEAQQEMDERYLEQAIETLLDHAQVSYPPVLVEEEIDTLVKDLEGRLKEHRLSLQDWLRLQGKTEEALREEFRPQAERQIRLALVLSTLAQAERLEVTEEEIEDAIIATSARYPGMESEMRRYLSSEEGVSALTARLMTNKTLQRLVEIVKGEAPPLPGEEGEGEGEGEETPEAPEAERQPAEVSDEEEAPTEAPVEPSGVETAQTLEGALAAEAAVAATSDEEPYGEDNHPEDG
ncbi:MAG: trigger factor, partial [Chloroflexi bacterium]